MLARLYDPTEGRILLDGYDLKEYDLADVRRSTGVIFQDYLRYQMTASQNIAVGDVREQLNTQLMCSSAEQS
jgi:ATP-binding cassette subfamily B protein